MGEALYMWVVTHGASDIPDDMYAAREWMVSVGVGQTATGLLITSPSLDLLRDFLSRQGLDPLARSPGDDPVVVETWL